MIQKQVKMIPSKKSNLSYLVRSLANQETSLFLKEYPKSRLSLTTAKLSYTTNLTYLVRYA